MTFDITQKSKIVIYGAGRLGQSKAQMLIEAGYEVIGFFDNNAEKIKEAIGLPVYMPCDDAFNRQEIVIIICVHNGLWHVEIAENLFDSGYNKILFIPLNSRYNFKAKEKMQLNYTRFEYEEYEKICEIPTYEELVNNEPNISNAVIYRNDKFVVAWISVNLIYTSCVLEHATDYGTPAELEEYANTPIPGMKPYVQLFRYIAGQNGEYKTFLYLLKKLQNTFDDYTDKEFIGDRIELYKEFQKQMNFGLSQFISAAPECVWNKKGFFNLLDGMTRTTFLYSKGFQYVPVKMSVDDFNHWCNFNQFQIVKGHLKKNSYETLFRVEHPGFTGIANKYETTNISELSAIQEYFGKKKYNQKAFLEYSPFGGEIARYFLRMGAKAFVYVKNETEKEYVKSIFTLCHTDNAEILIFNEGFDSVDVAYIVCDSFIREKFKSTVQREALLNSINEILIWEAEALFISDDIKAITEHTEFKVAEILPTIVDIDSRKIVIFERMETYEKNFFNN